MKNNQYPINVTDDIDIINNHCHDNYRSQLSNSQNIRNEIQNTQQKSTEKIDDTISVITDTSFSKTSEGRCNCCGKSGNY